MMLVEKLRLGKIVFVKNFQYGEVTDIEICYV